MTTINLTNKPESLDFATVADVKAFWGPSSDSGSLDTLIGGIITQLSERFTRILGQHVLRAERTEDYELGQRTSAFCLTGASLDSGDDFTLYEAERADLLATATASAATTYTLNYPVGMVRLYTRTGKGLSYARVVYTGGLATNTAGLKTDYPDLHMAALMQARYLLERRTTLGGNVTSVSGGGTQFMYQYRLLEDVQDILHVYRRAQML